VKLGRLNFSSINDNLGLVAEPVKKAFDSYGSSGIYVTEIDPNLADTAAFCEQYEIGMEISANCVIVEAKRADRIWYAACVILAINKADVNGVVRRYLDARKISFAPMDIAVKISAMEYGGITPIGLPNDWPIIIDKAVINAQNVIVGSGIRKSKLLVPSQFLATLSNAIVMDIVKSN
jgi:prolyl-tRNA editing enzyme YbaK/EbsC (Cys-tRNA(Pro) deacylase)